MTRAETLKDIESEFEQCGIICGVHTAWLISEVKRLEKVIATISDIHEDGSTGYKESGGKLAANQAVKSWLKLALDEEDEPEIIECSIGCGGCSCHIYPPCGHCTDGHGEERQ